MLRSRALEFQQVLQPAMLLLLGLAIVMAGSFTIGFTDKGLWVLFGIVAVIIGAGITVRPEIGLYILVFFIFTNMSDVLEVTFGIPSTNKPLVALLFVGTLANLVVLHHKPLIFRTTEIAVLGYGIVVALSLLFAEIRQGMLSVMLDWAKDFAILLIIVQQCTNERVWKNMQWTLVASAGFVALLSCYQVLTGDYSNDFYGLANAPVHEITEGFDSTRVTGPLVDPNYYAMILLIAYPIAGYRLLTDKSQVLKLLAGVAFLLIAATILFTYSRGGFLALVVVTILALRERKMDLIRIGGSVAIITVVMLPVLPKGFTDRMLTLTDILPGDLSMQTESSFRGRTSEALVATQMFYDRPILGVGRENYPEMYLDYSSRLGLDDRLEDREAHSMYLEVAAETGILGVLSFGTMLVVVFAGIQKAKRDLRAAEREDLVPWVSGAEFALVGYLIASIFLHADYARYFWLTVAFAVSTGVIAHAQLNQYQQRKHEEQLMRNELL